MIEIEMRDDSTVVCRPFGELELAAFTTLYQVTSDLARPGLEIVIDLGHVNFIDAVGASALISSVRRVTASGGTVLISNASPRLQWLLRLLGADRLGALASAPCRPGIA